MKCEIAQSFFVAVAITLGALSTSFCMRTCLNGGILTTQIDFTSLNSKVEFVLFSPTQFVMHLRCMSRDWTFNSSECNESELLPIKIDYYHRLFSLFDQTYRCLLKLNKLTRPEQYVWNWIRLRWIKTLFTETTKSDEVQSRFCNSFYYLLKLWDIRYVHLIKNANTANSIYRVQKVHSKRDWQSWSVINCITTMAERESR